MKLTDEDRVGLRQAFSELPTPEAEPTAPLTDEWWTAHGASIVQYRTKAEAKAEVQRKETAHRNSNYRSNSTRRAHLRNAITEPKQRRIHPIGLAPYPQVCSPQRSDRRVHQKH